MKSNSFHAESVSPLITLIRSINEKAKTAFIFNWAEKEKELTSDHKNIISSNHVAVISKAMTRRSDYADSLTGRAVMWLDNENKTKCEFIVLAKSISDFMNS